MAGSASLRRGRNLLCGLAIALAVAVPAHATAPPSAARRAQLARVLNQIRSLDGRLEQTIEAYNGARTSVAEIRQERVSLSRQLRFARSQLAIAQRRLGERLRAIYMFGEDDSTLAILLGSTSVPDFLDRWQAVSSIVAEDRQILAEAEQAERQVSLRDLRFETEEKRQQRLIKKQVAARKRIEAALVERRRLASSISGPLARSQHQERIQQEQLANLVKQRLAAQQGSQLRALQAADQQDVVGASAVSPDGLVTVAPPSPYRQVVGTAMHYLGVPYLWGGASPAGFDCSGLIKYVYAKVGVSLPHYAASQYTLGVPVARGDLQPGDLVFFHKLGHAGIYIGDGYFIQAPHTGDVVKISNLSEPWYTATYVGARRIL